MINLAFPSRIFAASINSRIPLLFTILAGKSTSLLDESYFFKGLNVFKFTPDPWISLVWFSVKLQILVKNFLSLSFWKITFVFLSDKENL